jgi:hypothetical protein
VRDRWDVSKNGIGDAAAVERPDALLIAVAQRNSGTHIEVFKNQWKGQTGVQEINRDSPHLELNDWDVGARYSSQALYVGMPCQYGLQAVGLAAEEVLVTRSEGRPNTERVYVRSGSVHAQSVRAKSVNFGVGVFDIGAAFGSDATDPLFDDGVQSAQDFLAQLGFLLGFVELAVLQELWGGG